MGADSQAGLSALLPDETISPEYPILVQNASLYTTYTFTRFPKKACLHKLWRPIGRGGMNLRAVVCEARMYQGHGHRESPLRTMNLPERVVMTCFALYFVPSAHSTVEISLS